MKRKRKIREIKKKTTGSSWFFTRNGELKTEVAKQKIVDKNAKYVH